MGADGIGFQFYVGFGGSQPKQAKAKPKKQPQQTQHVYPGAITIAPKDYSYGSIPGNALSYSTGSSYSTSAGSSFPSRAPSPEKPPKAKKDKAVQAMPPAPQDAPTQQV